MNIIEEKLLHYHETLEMLQVIKSVSIRATREREREMKPGSFPYGEAL